MYILQVLEKILEQDEEQKDVNLNNVPVPEKTFLEIFGALKAGLYIVILYVYIGISCGVDPDPLGSFDPI